MVAEDSLQGRDLQPVDLREGDRRLRRLRRRARGDGARGARRPGDLRADRDQGRADGLRRAARRSGTRPTAPTASSRSRSRPTWPTTSSGRSTARATSGSACRRPNVMIKIPGTPGGRRRDRAGDLRGHQRQRHAAVRGRGLRAGRRGLHPRARAPPGRGQAARTSPRWRASSSRGSTPRSTSSSRQLGREDLLGKAAIANARRAYASFERIFSGPRWDALRHAGAHVQRPLWASTGVKNPRLLRTRMYVDELVGRAHRQHDAADDAAGRRRPRPASRVRPPSATRRRSSTRSPRPASTSARSPTQLLIDGVSQFEEAMNRLLAGIEERRQGVHHRAAADDRGAAARASSPTPVAARVRRGHRAGRRAPDLAQGPVAVGRRRRTRRRSATGSAG